MTGTVLLAVAALAAQADGSPTFLTASPFAQALRGQDVVMRGQSGSFTGPVLGAPQPVTSYYQTPTYDPNGGAMYSDPSLGGGYAGNAMPYTGDPWLNGGGTMPYSGGGNPYPGTAAGSYSIGLNGAQPYKFGWSERLDVAWIADASTNVPTSNDDLSVFETNYEKELTVPVFGNWIFSAAGQYNLRLFNGPDGRPVTLGDAYPAPGGVLHAASELPGNVHRFGLGLKLRTPNIGPWALEGGFNPSLATDFDRAPSGDSILYDAHAVAFLQLNPRFTVALGAQYWDRVDQMIIPYAGVIWTPNDYLEMRLVFPKPRISLFVGTPFGLPTWAYVQGEYHVEAYEVGIHGYAAVDTSLDGLVTPGEFRAVDSQRIQLEDWRVTGGFYTEGSFWTGFIEAGAVLDRTVSYDSSVNHFDVDPAFIIRTGIRY
ncbi:MAG: hypothetical protein ACK5Q5_08815 [Planctomycetaceae bacterium]